MTIITSSHFERARRYIALHFGTATFTDWVRQAPCRPASPKRMSDDLLYDLKRDRTLPETFDSLDQFRFYLKSQHACQEALRLAGRVWGRYQRWARKAVRA